MLGSLGIWSSSKGMVLVPDLSTLTNTQAIALIEASGLTYSGSSSTTTNNINLNNKVASQIPNPNDLVPYESEVSFIYYNYVEITTTTTTTQGTPPPSTTTTTTTTSGGGGTPPPSTTTTTTTTTTAASSGPYISYAYCDNNGNLNGYSGLDISFGGYTSTTQACSATQAQIELYGGTSFVCVAGTASSPLYTDLGVTCSGTPTTTTTTTQALYNIWAACTNNNDTVTGGYGLGPSNGVYNKTTGTTSNSSLTTEQIVSQLGVTCSGTPTTTTTTTSGGTLLYRASFCGDGTPQQWSSSQSCSAAQAEATANFGTISNWTCSRSTTYPAAPTCNGATTTTTTTSPTTTTTTGSLPSCPGTITNANAYTCSELGLTYLGGPSTYSIGTGQQCCGDAVTTTTTAAVTTTTTAASVTCGSQYGTVSGAVHGGSCPDGSCPGCTAYQEYYYKCSDGSTTSSVSGYTGLGCSSPTTTTTAAATTTTTAAATTTTTSGYPALLSGYHTCTPQDVQNPSSPCISNGACVNNGASGSSCGSSTTAATTADTTAAPTTTAAASTNKTCSQWDYLNIPAPNCMSVGACDPLGSQTPC